MTLAFLYRRAIGRMNRSIFTGFLVKPSPTNVAFVTIRFHAFFLLFPVLMTLNISSSAIPLTLGSGTAYLAALSFRFSLMAVEDREFEQKKREWDEEADAKTAKNRAKRQKKKERSKAKGGDKSEKEPGVGSTSDAPLKKRRLVNGQELVFRRPGADSDAEGEDDDEHGPMPPSDQTTSVPVQAAPLADTPRIVIHEDD